MCGEGRPDDNGFGLRVFAGSYADAYLQRAENGHPGYTLVIWRRGHVADPTELSDEDASAYFAEVLRVARAIESQYRPLKMNFEMLGNALPHLHTHVVPRYRDDGAAGKPAAFMARDPSADGRRPEADVVREAASLRELLR